MMVETSTDEPQLNVAVLMYVAARSVEARACDAVVLAGAADLTPAQARLMAQIDAEGTRVVTLAARARIAKQSAAFLVDQLERGGYVVRVADPRDGRAKLIRLSPHGRAIGDIADAEVARVLKEWEQHLGAARMRHLEKTMTMLREITDPWA